MNALEERWSNSLVEMEERCKEEFSNRLATMHYYYRTVYDQLKDGSISLSIADEALSELQKFGTKLATFSELRDEDN